MTDERRRKYESDVYYEAWRRGRNPDAIDPDELNDCYHDRIEPFDAVDVCVPRHRQDDEDEP